MLTGGSYCILRRHYVIETDEIPAFVIKLLQNYRKRVNVVMIMLF